MNSEVASKKNLQYELHQITIGVSALRALSVIVPEAIDQETLVSSDEIGSLLRCVEYKLHTATNQLLEKMNEKPAA